MESKGKVALITGGAVRVGRALTLALARAGADVVINYHHSAPEAQATADEARALGVRALPVQADIAHPSGVHSLIQMALTTFGRVDILVNSASPWIAGGLQDTGLETWHQVLGALLDGPFLLAQALAPGMTARGEGLIINILDRSVFEVWPSRLAHTVGKSGLAALTRALAVELAPAVRVNAIIPGYVLPPTDFSVERIARTAERIPLRRWGTPEDVAEALLYLIRADYVTGEALVVDGGEGWRH